MAKDLLVKLENHPGTLAEMGEALGKAGVNMDGVCGFPCGTEGNTHVLVEDEETAKLALSGPGISVEAERDVLVLDIADKPGEFGKLARQMADAGVNIELFYITMGNQIVLGVDDIKKAKQVLKG